MPSHLIRIIKLGGSLLDWPEWPAKLRAWLAEQPAARNVLIVGGGKLADALREFDAVHRLPPVQAHWLAIDIMSITARLAASLLHGALLVDRINDLRNSDLPSLVVFDVAPFLRDIEPTLPGRALPHDWTVTSDSISARLAFALAADELVLLKSASADHATPSTFADASAHAGSTAPSELARLLDLSALARAGYVDAFFPEAASQVASIRLVNLRDVPSV